MRPTMGYCHKHRDMGEAEYRLQKHTHAESHLTYEQMHTDHTAVKKEWTFILVMLSR